MIDFTELPKDGIRFEQLVREVLLREDFEVRWTGAGPDGGRDLLLVERAAGPIAPFDRTWVVSCKHFAHGGNAVGVNDLDRSMVDSCRAQGATGFLLACSTHPSSALVTRLKEVEASTQIVCRCWDAVEIERRLMTPRSFSLISAFFPRTSQAIPWAVYNAGSPYFWCGSHLGHFFYMSSRVAAGVPQLNDVEAILGKLAAIALPSGGEFGQRERLRLRAVYFDNKNENYLVFVDYLVPTTIDGKIISQVLSAESVLEMLHDGYGLYQDAEASWYPTHWDVLRVPTFQLADRFDEDDKSFYSPHLPSFEGGSPRAGAASAFEWRHSSWNE